jgi:hypothetical protein
MLLIDLSGELPSDFFGQLKSENKRTIITYHSGDIDLDKMEFSKIHYYNIEKNYYCIFLTFSDFYCIVDGCICHDSDCDCKIRIRYELCLSDLYDLTNEYADKHIRYFIDEKFS